MNTHKALASLITAALLAGFVLPVDLNAGESSAPHRRLLKRDPYKRDVAVEGIADIRDDFVPLNNKADYTQITMMTYDGKPVILSLNDNLNVLSLTCSGCSSATMELKDNATYSVIDSVTGTDSLSLDVTGKMEYRELYYVKVCFTSNHIEQTQTDIYVSVDEKGTAFFVKSPVYDFNVDRCSECWTDDQSLAECLEPMNDIECDDPEIIRMATEITAGATTDWEKSFAIYDYIINEFAYDYVQLDDYTYNYQDDALILMRRKIAICEGMANVFVALARACGVPATVSYGIGEDCEQIMNNRYLINYDEWPNHAWAMVCLGGTWYHIDPTWDCQNAYKNGDSYDTGIREDSAPTYNYYMVPIEIFSYSHKICDADTRHGIESSGNAGTSARYEISRDGVMTVYGSGKLEIPDYVNGYWKLVFDEDCTITSIGEDCFVDRDVLTTVILPDTVTELCDGAFHTCEDLEYIYLPDGLQTIGRNCFILCDELAYVYVPDSVTDIGDWAFDYCPRLIISIPARLSGFDNINSIKLLEVIERK